MQQRPDAAEQRLLAVAVRKVKRRTFTLKSDRPDALRVRGGAAVVAIVVRARALTDGRTHMT
jgi:hypothetical protein